MKFTIGLWIFAFNVVRLLSAQGGSAQGGTDDGKLLTSFQNPVANLISVPFQNNVNFPIGQYSRNQDVLDIEPVIPFHISPDWLIISRWIAPVVYQPDLGAGCRASGRLKGVICDTRDFESAPEGGANGLGDINPTFLLSPVHPGKLIWGFGPTFLAPTATSPTLGEGKWGAGPSLVLLAQPKPWTIGVITNNIWSFAGNEQRRHVNQFMANWWVNYNMAHGWYLITSPIVTSNWLAPDHNRWLVPFGGGIGRMVRVGHQPVVWELESYYNAVHPRDLPFPKWQVRLQVALLFPEAK